MAESILTASIAIGIVVSFLFSMIVGIYPGGIIVPGYIALYMDNPLNLVATFGVSWFTYFIVSRFSYVLIIYGRRKKAITILLGFFFGYFFNILVFGHYIGETELAGIDVIGYIIPGLIASSMDSYGVITTLSSVITCSVIVKLLLILLMVP
ncbi:MAG: poly-gamma-glutamate biosynthesis protein PgsC [Candidatus Parabeggiatoa sp.]|nr:poly-gamma-glutamate biosynthesis protein PgsC [Candidatus Parabeggiatoa sp.]